MLPVLTKLELVSKLRAGIGRTTLGRPVMGAKERYFVKLRLGIGKRSYCKQGMR